MITNELDDGVRAQRCVVVSPEMTILRGRGRLALESAPEGAVAVAFALGGIDIQPHLTVAGSKAVQALLDQDEPVGRIVLLLAPTAVRRIEGRTLPASEDTRVYHLPSELRVIALALRDCDRRGEAGEIYLTAKGIELVYETWAMLDREALTPMAIEAGLSQADSQRILAARRLIDDRWHEKLSLEQVAALCGLNREKLTRGFRQMFACSVTEALVERRLTQACRMLATTDLPVSSIGYENGYLNNASFSRAFGRRFGLSPSDYRAQQLAA